MAKLGIEERKHVEHITREPESYGFARDRPTPYEYSHGLGVLITSKSLHRIGFPLAFDHATLQAAACPLAVTYEKYDLWACTMMSFAPLTKFRSIVCDLFHALASVVKHHEPEMSRLKRLTVNIICPTDDSHESVCRNPFQIAR